MNHFDEYDVGASEIHHNQKADSPSGTAKAVTSLLVDHIERKKTITYDKANQPIAFEELHCASLRCGSNPGFHSVTFDSPADTVTISHQARSREGFARGAITAAEWVQNKKGLFTMHDLLGAF
jgi:4-hydroxy-tetrahydrodipicolinate reductase